MFVRKRLDVGIWTQSTEIGLMLVFKQKCMNFLHIFGKLFLELVKDDKRPKKKYYFTGSNSYKWLLKMYFYSES